MVLNPIHKEKEDQERKIANINNWWFVLKHQQEKLVKLSYKQQTGHLKANKLTPFLKKRYFLKNYDGRHQKESSGDAKHVTRWTQ